MIQNWLIFPNENIRLRFQICRMNQRSSSQGLLLDMINKFGMILQGGAMTVIYVYDSPGKDCSFNAINFPEGTTDSEVLKRLGGEILVKGSGVRLVEVHVSARTIPILSE